jgi:hypothetical protein
MCRHCGDCFDVHSTEKVAAGGRIDECPACMMELGDDSPPKYLAVAAGNGKMSDITVLKFDDEASREAFRQGWLNNTGYNKGKSCQLGSHLTPMSGMKFDQVAENRANDNHKGRS